MFQFPIKQLAMLIAGAFFMPLPSQAAPQVQNIHIEKQSSTQSNIINYSPQPQAWQDKLRDLERGKPTVFRIVQLGDSHTAGAYFTDTLRQNLQMRWGDAGMGWVFPAAVSGQRTTTVDYSGSNWQMMNSRRDTADFPLGGVLVRSKSQQNLVFNAKNMGEQKITFAMRPIFTDSPLKITDAHNKTTLAYSLHGNKWQYFTFTAPTPIRIQAADNALWELGAINFENQRNGVIVSALGLNGTQLIHWGKWRKDWENDLVETQADLVILAYGTNEAFNEQINVAQTQKYWQETLDRIRQTLPNAGILIVGAPESLTAQTGECGTRPKRLDEIQNMQQNLAQKNGVLYWSWQNAMGGKCSMNGWINNKLARNDGVHFTPQGYQKAAENLARDLMKLAQ